MRAESKVYHIVLWDRFWKLERNFQYINADESEYYYSFDDVELTLWNWYQKIWIIWAQRVCQELEKINQYLRSRYRRYNHNDREIQIVWNFEKLFIFKEVVWQQESGSII